MHVGYDPFECPDVMMHRFQHHLPEPAQPRVRLHCVLPLTLPDGLHAGGST